MGSFSIWHWLIVLVIVMLIFGTKKLRNIGADLGGAVKGFKDGMKSDEDAKKPAGEIGAGGSTINREIDIAELSKVKTEFESAARSFQSDVESKVAEAEHEIRETQASLERAIDTHAQAANEA